MRHDETFVGQIQLMDIPKAIAVHEALGIGLLAGVWAGCYRYQPTQRGLASFGSASAPMLEAMGKATRTIERWGSWTRRLPVLRNAEQGRLLISLAESTVARKLAMPATVPLKLWLSWNIVLLSRRPRAEGSRDDAVR